MTALHVWLIALGGALAAGPVILHLLMQEKPKRLPFPALRFVLQRQQNARRSFRLRHWILLSLRVAVVGLVALALSRPAAATALFGSSLLLGATLISGLCFLFLALFWRHRVQSRRDTASGSTAAQSTAPKTIPPQSTAGRANVRDPQDPKRPMGRPGRTSLWPVWLLLLVVAGHALTAAWLLQQLLAGDAGPVLTGKQPVAAAIVIDTSPRMQYRKDNQSRLERAQELALAIVRMLPNGSQISIIDTSPDPVGLSLDPAAAQVQINALQITYLSQPLPMRARAAAQLLRDSPLDGRELYLISDLSRPSWTASEGQVSSLGGEGDLSIYLVDVGAKSYDNWSIDQWMMPAPTLTPGGLFQVRATVARAAVEGDGQDLIRQVAADHANRTVGAPSSAATSTIGDDPSATAELEGPDAGQPTADSLLGQMARDWPSESRTLRLLIEKPEPGRPVYRNGETLLPSSHWERITQVQLAPGQATEIAFSVPDLPVGVHHGWIEIDGGDALSFDNRRYFTVTVQPAWKALLLTGPEVNDANLLEAIAPTTLRERGQEAYDCQVGPTFQIAELDLSQFSLVCLLNPGPLSETQWNLLYRYVNNGGSLAIFLGHNALDPRENRLTVHPSFNQPAALRLLPGRLEDPWRRADASLFLDPTAWDHPIFARLQPLRTQISWDRLPIFMHYGLDLQPVQNDEPTATDEPAREAEAPAGMAASQLPEIPAAADDPTQPPGRPGDFLAGDAAQPNDRAALGSTETSRSVRVLATYSNNMPALVESMLGQGLVITMTTPITDPMRPDSGRRPWNSFAIGGDWSFPYWLLINELARYLATSKSVPLNGFVGDSYVLPNDQMDAPNQYALYRPESQEPIDVVVDRGRLYLDFNDRPGAYRLRGVDANQQTHLRGFSVNVPATHSDLSRVGKAQLDRWLGAGQYLVAENEEQIERVQGMGRQGLEFYPSLVRLLAVAFLAELLFSNWFYQEPPRKKSAQELASATKS